MAKYNVKNCEKKAIIRIMNRSLCETHAKRAMGQIKIRRKVTG